MDKVMAIREIKAALALTSARLSETAAPMANRSVPASGVPAAMPKLAAAPPAVPAGKGVPVSGVPVSVPAKDLDDLAVPAAHPLARDAAPIASSAPIAAGALAKFDAVPAR